jgi:chitodextrinase
VLVAAMAMPAIAGAQGSRDKTPPSIPTGLTASATSHSRINLAWRASSDKSGVAGYRVLRNGVRVATTSATAYADTGLSAARRYTYSVAAFDRAGNVSAASSPASATTAPPPDTAAPTSPSGLSATAISASQINLAWRASSDKFGVAGYRVLRNGVRVATTSATAYADTGLSAATRYTYSVAAFDRAGNVSPPSPAASATTRAVSPPRLRSAVGTNLDPITYFSPQVPFVDVMKSSSEWISGSGSEWDDGGALDLDANGWVRSLAPGQVARRLTLRDFGDRYPGGRYLVRYKGEGTLKFGFAAAVVSEQRGEMVIEVTPNDGGIYLSIEATNPENYLREIEIIMPGGICEGDPFTHAASADDCGRRRFISFAEERSILFYPVFADRLRGYSVLRFMDWMRTNNSRVATWAQRTPFSYSTWAAESGAPVEVMIALANLVKAHPWFNMPHQADEAYAQNFAALLEEKLDPALGVYIEHSNEVWNLLFTQSAGLSLQAEALGLLLAEYHALRTRTLAGIFKHALCAERVVAVLGGQAVSTWVATSGLDYLNGRFGAAALGVDAVAIAPYFGVSPTPAEAGQFTAMTMDEFVDYVRSNVLPSEAAHMASHRAVADNYGLRLFTYEGGQHMVGVAGAQDDAALNTLFDNFNRDPRIKQLYLDYLVMWKSAGGELFVHFNDVSQYTKWGRWGALEYVAQPRSESPKFDALQTFIEQTPVWWRQLPPPAASAAARCPEQQ